MNNASVALQASMAKPAYEKIGTGDMRYDRSWEQSVNIDIDDNPPAPEPQLHESASRHATASGISGEKQSGERPAAVATKAPSDERRTAPKEASKVAEW